MARPLDEGHGHHDDDDQTGQRAPRPRCSPSLSSPSFASLLSSRGLLHAHPLVFPLRVRPASATCSRWTAPSHFPARTFFGRSRFGGVPCPVRPRTLLPVLNIWNMILDFFFHCGVCGFFWSFGDGGTGPRRHREPVNSRRSWLLYDGPKVPRNGWSTLLNVSLGRVWTTAHLDLGDLGLPFIMPNFVPHVGGRRGGLSHDEPLVVECSLCHCFSQTHVEGLSKSFSISHQILVGCFCFVCFRLCSAPASVS